jgi:hypothetical protein
VVITNNGQTSQPVARNFVEFFQGGGRFVWNTARIAALFPGLYPTANLMGHLVWLRCREFGEQSLATEPVLENKPGFLICGFPVLGRGILPSLARQVFWNAGFQATGGLSEPSYAIEASIRKILFGGYGPVTGHALHGLAKAFGITDESGCTLDSLAFVFPRKISRPHTSPGVFPI